MLEEPIVYQKFYWYFLAYRKSYKLYAWISLQRTVQPLQVVHHCSTTTGSPKHLHKKERFVRTPTGCLPY